jgi:hypothetical protein
MAYFLISVSNKTNLELCIQHALAGFTNSINGVWTFSEVKEGDFISFLYGAKVYNLYKVKKKIAIKEADRIGPWPPVTFQMSGRTYYFPFRLILNPIRKFTEPMVRQEFAYVAENLLLRGGYRKTHFQADQTTLQAVSQMGELYKQQPILEFRNNYEFFEPLFTFDRKSSKIPEVFYFQEFILQSLIRHYLSQLKNLQSFLECLGLNDWQADSLEVLGEKAFPEGHVDILIKERFPNGYCRKIIVEVKTGKIQKRHVEQLQKYMDELDEECKTGVLIGKSAPKSIIEEAKHKKIECFTYSFENLNLRNSYSFDELLSRLSILKP